jgi:hypothetical protein
MYTSGQYLDHAAVVGADKVVPFPLFDLQKGALG